MLHVVPRKCAISGSVGATLRLTELVELELLEAASAVRGIKQTAFCDKMMKLAPHSLVQ